MIYFLFKLIMMEKMKERDFIMKEILKMKLNQWGALFDN